MGKRQYLENVQSMNVFYTLVMKIKETCEKEKDCYWFAHQFEVAIKVGNFRVKPDAVIKYKLQRMPSNMVLALEYKDCHDDKHIIKTDQITKYENLDEANMRESGLEILRHADFEGLSLIYRNDERFSNLTQNVIIRYKEVCSSLRFPFGIYEISELHSGSSLRVKRIVGESFAIIDLIDNNSFLYKELCIFDFKLEMPKRVPKVEKLPEIVRDNVSVFLALIIGYSLRFSRKDEPFTIVDVIKFSTPTTWEIMEKTKNVHRTLRVFDKIVKRLLVKNKYLVEIEETTIKLENVDIKVGLYKFNIDKNLMHKKTMKSLHRLIEKYLESEIVKERLTDEMPLFKWRQEETK